MYEIQPGDAQFLKYFRTTNTHNRPLELNRVLNRLRMEPMAGKRVIVCTVPHREWALGILGSKRGEPIKLLDGRFTKLADAQWQLLKIRWAIHTSIPWPSDLE